MERTREQRRIVNLALRGLAGEPECLATMMHLICPGSEVGRVVSEMSARIVVMQCRDLVDEVNRLLEARAKGERLEELEALWADIELTPPPSPPLPKSDEPPW